MSRSDGAITAEQVAGMADSALLASGQRWDVLADNAAVRRWFAWRALSFGLLWGLPILALGGLYAWWTERPLPSGYPLLLFLVAAAVVAGLAFLRFRWWKRWRFGFGPDDLVIVKPGLTSLRVLIPYSRVQFIETRAGPLQRSMDLCSLEILTAAGGFLIPCLDAHHAATVRERLEARAAER